MKDSPILPTVAVSSRSRRSWQRRRDWQQGKKAGSDDPSTRWGSCRCWCWWWWWNSTGNYEIPRPGWNCTFCIFETVICSLGPELPLGSVTDQFVKGFLSPFCNCITLSSALVQPSFRLWRQLVEQIILGKVKLYHQLLLMLHCTFIGFMCNFWFWAFDRLLGKIICPFGPKTSVCLWWASKVYNESWLKYPYRISWGATSINMIYPTPQVNDSVIASCICLFGVQS